MTNFRPGYLNQGDPLGLTTYQQSITADNTVVQTAGFSLIQLSPDSATASQRTITLASGDTGYLGQQVVTLENIAGSSYTLELADSGNCKLQTAWTPLQWDTLTLIWDGSYWVEQCRSSAAGLLPFALTSAQIIVGNASNVAAAVAMSGTVAITNAGVTSVPLVSGHILVGSAGGVAADVAMSGDVTITNAGVTAIGAGKIAVSQLSSAVMAEATVTITQAQMLALSTPVTLVAAQGSGTVIVVDEIECRHTYSTAAYATGSDVSIEYATSGTDIVLMADTLFLATASANTVMRPTIYNLDNSTGSDDGFDVLTNANKAVQITASNFTLGNVANIFKFRVRYHVITLLT